MLINVVLGLVAVALWVAIMVTLSTLVGGGG